MQKRGAACIAGFFVLLALLAGCGQKVEGGDPIDGSKAVFDGSWGGTWGDSNGFLKSFSFDISEESVSNVKFDGELQEGLTGSIAALGGNLYSVTLSDGAEYVMMADALKKYGFLLLKAPLPTFAVVQKGVFGPANWYEQGDFAAYWKGSALNVEADLDVVSSEGGELTVNSGGYFTGYDGLGSFDGMFQTYSSDFGAIEGDFAEGPEAGVVVGVLSPSKNFFGVMVCTGSYPEECVFGALKKQ